MTKAKSKSTRKAPSRKQATPELPVTTVEAKTGHRLIITLPILAAVLFTIGYLQIGVQPSNDETNALPGSRTAKVAPATDLSALQIAPATQVEMLPLSTPGNEGSLAPTAGDSGDTNASAVAQPTVTSLQAPTTPYDDSAIQAPKSPGDINALVNIL
jgi:hypothetical protein